MKFYIIYSIDIPLYNETVGTETLLNMNVPFYIQNNMDKFIITEENYESDEYEYYEFKTCHRKYTGLLNENEFLQFISDFVYNPTCDTMGSLTLEYGLLPAFCVEILNNYNIEDLYISILFDKELENEFMITIENQIREAIENGTIDLKTFKFDN